MGLAAQVVAGVTLLACVALVAVLVQSRQPVSALISEEFQHDMQDSEDYLETQRELVHAQNRLQRAHNLLTVARQYAAHKLNKKKEKDEKEKEEPEMPHPWGYESDEDGVLGPDKWGVEPSYLKCATGMRQSPIDIQSVLAYYNKALPNLFWTFITGLDEVDQPRIVYDGHYVVLSGMQAQLRWGGSLWHLDDIHFHTRSENRINGKDFAVEMQMQHRNDHGELMIVSWLFDTDQAPQPYVENLEAHFPPPHKGHKPREAVPAPSQPSFEQFLTELMASHDTAAYYTFKGSLTHPPCTEGVQWLVMTDPIGISHEQVVRLMQLEGMNRRKTQPINGRLVDRSY